MEINKICPKCGCTEIAYGKQNGYAKMFPLKDILNFSGSNVIAEICTDCGYILEMRVKDPEKFK